MKAKENPVLLAYIDPNSGSLIWQVLAAGLLGSMLYFRNLIWHLASFRFMLKRSKDDISDIQE